MPKCAIIIEGQRCQNETDYIWQPDLDTDAFYRPGYHIRGYLAIRVCEECREKIIQGEVVQFKRKGVLCKWENGTLQKSCKGS